MTNRFINYFAFIAVFIAAMGLFTIKQKVTLLNYQLIEIVKQTKQEKDTLHLLKAEFAYLNNPDRLRTITSNYLQLSSIKPSQLIKDPLYNDVVSGNKEVITASNAPRASTKWRYKRMPGKYAYIQTVSSRIR